MHMGYMHIDNLYKANQQYIIGMFSRVYALEKVHGTSANLDYDATRGGDKLLYCAGGESHPRFVGLFAVDLPEKFEALAQELVRSRITVYGEAYGGSQQKMSHTYGPNLAFIVFDVKVDDRWLDVPAAEAIARKLGLEFVPWDLISCTVEYLDRERDRPSVVAARRGVEGDKPREGIVIRPLVELTLADGARVIAKHKGTAFQERQMQPTIDAGKQAALADAAAVAEEWVTGMRLTHVLDKLKADGIAVDDIRSTSYVLSAMVADVYREAEGEIVESKPVEAAIRKKTAELFKRTIGTVS